ncbi:MAG: ABC transporter permease [Chloroflexota bacterium]
MAKSASLSSKARQGLAERFISRFDWRSYVVYVAFVVIFAMFAITQSQSGFLTPFNLLNIVAQTAPISLMAVGETLVIAAAEIDLSVGSLAGLSSVTTAMAVNAYGVPQGIAAGLLTGLVVGLFNGLVVTRLRIPSFLVTLGMLGIAQGAAMWITNTSPVPILDNNFNNPFGSANAGQIPVLVFWTIAALVLGHILLRKTRFGRQALATGGNEPAARFSGVNTQRLKVTVLVLSALLASVAGMLYAGRLQSGRFQWGQGDELSVIASVVIGGTNLFGGSASVTGAVTGSLLVGLINNGLILMGLEYSQQVVARSSLIILAVALTGRRKQ